MSGKAVKGARAPGRNVAPANRIDDLIRKLMEHAGQRAESREESGASGSKVLLSHEVDGVRCVLTKTYPPESETISLSPREQEIVRLIAKGYPNKAIALVLEISVWTVSTHLRRIFAKLGVSSRAAVVARTLSSGSFGAD